MLVNNLLWSEIKPQARNLRSNTGTAVPEQTLLFLWSFSKLTAGRRGRVEWQGWWLVPQPRSSRLPPKGNGFADASGGWRDKRQRRMWLGGMTAEDFFPYPRPSASCGLSGNVSLLMSPLKKKAFSDTGCRRVREGRAPSGFLDVIYLGWKSEWIDGVFVMTGEFV